MGEIRVVIMAKISAKVVRETFRATSRAKATSKEKAKKALIIKATTIKATTIKAMTIKALTKGIRKASTKANLVQWCQTSRASTKVSRKGKDVTRVFNLSSRLVSSVGMMQWARIRKGKTVKVRT